MVRVTIEEDGGVCDEGRPQGETKTQGSGGQGRKREGGTYYRGLKTKGPLPPVGPTRRRETKKLIILGLKEGERLRKRNARRIRRGKGEKKSKTPPVGGDSVGNYIKGCKGGE